MTEAEKEAHKRHIISMYGSITDETFVEPTDNVPYVLEVF